MTRSPLAARRRKAAALGLAAGFFALVLAASASAQQVPLAPTPGIWQQHKMAFQFMGFTSTYSCDGLADKLRLLLLAAGARRDVKSEPGACASGFGRPDKFARADLVYYTLQPAGTAGSEASGPTVPGVWRPVAFASHSPLQLQLGDCELVDQFRSQVLKSFATRNLENHVTCIPHQESGSVIDLRFEVFTAAPSAPAAGGSPAPASQALGSSSDLIVYPQKGQSGEQMARDKYECYRWAVGQAGYDPAQSGTADPAKRPEYLRAQAACLTGRGYSVR